jgi:hypothetical protein
MISQKVVTPVKTGVQIIYNLGKPWIPASAGMMEKRISLAV